MRFFIRFIMKVRNRKNVSIQSWRGLKIHNLIIQHMQTLFAKEFNIECRIKFASQKRMLQIKGTVHFAT